MVARLRARLSQIRVHSFPFVVTQCHGKPQGCPTEQSFASRRACSSYAASKSARRRDSRRSIGSGVMACSAQGFHSPKGPHPSNTEVKKPLLRGCRTDCFKGLFCGFRFGLGCCFPVVPFQLVAIRWRWILVRLWTMQISRHSLSTASRLRRRKPRYPRLALRCPKTGSTVIWRLA